MPKDRFNWKNTGPIKGFKSLKTCHLKINLDKKKRPYKWVIQKLYFKHNKNMDSKAKDRYTLHEKRGIKKKFGSLENFLTSANDTLCLHLDIFSKINAGQLSTILEKIFQSFSKLKILYLEYESEDITNIIQGLSTQIPKAIKIFIQPNKQKEDFQKQLIISKPTKELPLSQVPTKLHGNLPNEYQYIYFEDENKEKKDNTPGLIGASNGLIYLVQKKSDKSLWVAKFNQDGKGTDKDEAIEYYDLFRKIFQNPVQIYKFPNVVIKNFIDGHTLAYYLITFEFFYGIHAEKLQKMYKDMYIKIWNQKMYILDSNPDNVMFDKSLSQISIIDSRGYIKCSSKKESYFKGLGELYRWINNDWVQCTSEKNLEHLTGDHTVMTYYKYLMYNFLDSWKQEIIF